MDPRYQGRVDDFFCLHLLNLLALQYLYRLQKHSRFELLPCDFGLDNLSYRCVVCRPELVVSSGLFCRIQQLHLRFTELNLVLRPELIEPIEYFEGVYLDQLLQECRFLLEVLRTDWEARNMTKYHS